MELLQLITERFSPRAFSEKEISEQEIKALFKAASLAASSYNEQPWRFVYALKSNQQDFNNILDCVLEFNKPWAKNAAALVVCVAKNNLTLNDKTNEHAWHDLGLAVGNLSIQALSMDIYLRQIGGFMANKTKEILAIPEGYSPVSVIALGFLGDLNNLTPELQEKEKAAKQLKPLEEIVFNGRWN
jgi:nitroreductase